MFRTVREEEILVRGVKCDEISPAKSTGNELFKPMTGKHAHNKIVADLWIVQSSLLLDQRLAIDPCLPSQTHLAVI